MKPLLISLLLITATAFAETTTVVTPEGDIIICTVSESGVVICL